ncbi:MAG: alkaline phosphatase [Hyphomicrobiales bacterium]|nr:alkaline phosphatase [Hyphomicrobiales bacterium]
MRTRLTRSAATTFLLTGVAATAFLVGPAMAASIFPVDRADILSGSRFDFKVEFNGVVNPDDVKVTVNGEDFTNVLGKGDFVAKEDGVDASAIIVRDVSLLRPGLYVVEAAEGDHKATVTWNVYQTSGTRHAKNVILFIADGLSIAHRTAARIMSKGIAEGKYKGVLAMDDMPHMGLIGTSGVDSIITDSANSASAYNTGHKSSVNALGVYADRTPDTLDDPKQETLAELVKRRLGMAVGVVSDAELEDATPAAVVAHTRRRAEKAQIAEMFYDLQPEVMLGGGSAYFLPQSTPGSKRKDEKNLVDMFQQQGFRLATSGQEMTAAVNDPATTRLLGLFHTGNMDGALDRLFLRPNYVEKFPDQPDLTEMTDAAIKVLSRNPNGFFLAVEAALVDKYSHPLDWERAVFDTIMFDQAVAIAKRFAEQRGDTLVIVTGDHTHGLAIVGTIDDDKPGEEMRDKVGIYADAGYPAYEDADGDGYPDRVDVVKRLAVFFNNYPDHYETWRPKLDGTFAPAIQNENRQYVANEAYKDIPGATFVPGNLPRDADTGVHTADDLVVTAMGPGSDMIRGFMDNTETFRVMVEALGINGGPRTASAD